MAAIDANVPFVAGAAAAARLAADVAVLRDKPPEDIASEGALLARQRFLQETLGARETADAFERIILGDELQSITYLQRGAIAARAIARVNLGSAGSGTGFLIAPNVLITNNHVLADKATAASAMAQFRYELDLNDSPIGPVNYRLNPDALFFTLPQLDFTVVAVRDTADDGSTPLSQFGHLPLLDVTGKASEGEWLTIIQHPDGGLKQVCVRENKFLRRENDVVWYSTDTKPGSSGSPVFNNDWYVVALHHKGVMGQKDDGTQGWVANEGIRASRIAQTLKQALPQNPLLQPLFSATPASARISEPTSQPPAPRLSARENSPMTDRTISVPFDVRFQVQSDGQVVPLSIVPRGAVENTGAGSLTAFEKAKPVASFDAPFDPDYSARKGFNPDFLGGGSVRVGFPKLSPSLKAEAAELLPPLKGNILHYHNYSVVMHAKRRLAIYSAASVTFGNRFDMSRPPDVWRRDPRILDAHQLENWYYAANKFDRGHLTRREDLEFGKTPKVALGSAADTCHWTNCTPQHERFNQNREIWQGIERYVLEQSILEGNINAQIITGPILDGGDPEYKKVQYPLQYWKVVAALTSEGKLFATAYVASQEEVISQFGIEVTEVPFGAYKSFQTKISEIERLTGLEFVAGTKDDKSLRDHDPLEQAPTRRRRRARSRAAESTAVTSIPAGYYEITQFDDIEL